jgi:hypothetical protein
MYRGFLLGATVALGAVMLVPGVASALARAGKPMARAAMRSGAVAYDEFRAAAAETYEQVEDIVAEVREEMHEKRQAEMEQAAAEAADAGGDGD